MSWKPRSSAATALAVLAVSGIVLAACGGGDGADGVGSGVRADQFEQIPLGAVEDEIRYELGEPAAEREAGGDLCLEYPESSGDGLGRRRMFRFCFRDGVLVGKQAY